MLHACNYQEPTPKLISCGYMSKRDFFTGLIPFLPYNNFLQEDSVKKKKFSHKIPKGELQRNVSDPFVL